MLYDINEYDYQLPEELIAQHPAEPRDSSKLMILDRNSGKILHRIFRDIVEFLESGDLLVINNTKVIPARLKGKKETGAKIEILLLEEMEENKWKALVKPGSKIRIGHNLIVGDLKIKVIDHLNDGTRILEFPGSKKEVWQKIKEYGYIPLPPYIKSEVDANRYQTEFAKEEGAVAAPTAGLHFTKDLIKKIKEKNVDFAEVTLHVGIGTFRPIKVKDIREHEMHEEYFKVPKETVLKIKETKKKKKRVIAVGTTVVRTLETITRLEEKDEYFGKTKLYIYPPFEFKMVDSLITNFHLPKSSLLVLVSAFAGKELIMKAYKLAVKMQYRFFSFGDAMFII